MTHAAAPDSVLILTPLKNAARFAEGYFDGLAALTYPAARLSLGLLESDSDDDTHVRFATRLTALSGHFAAAQIWRRDFGWHMPPGLPRWHHAMQLPRRKVLAKARNHLLFRALDDQDWVLWLDVDVVFYPPDLIERLLAAGRDIVQPHCVQQPGGPTFDRNAWREHGRVRMEDVRDGPDLVRLDAVGGTVLLVRADRHRDGLVFPCFPYGAPHPAVRRPGPFPGIEGEIETEGLGLMALDMGAQAWGMPRLEVLHAEDPPSGLLRQPLRRLGCLFEIDTDDPALHAALDTRALPAEQPGPILHRENIRVLTEEGRFRIDSGGAEDVEFDLAALLNRLDRRMAAATRATLPRHGYVNAACLWHGDAHVLILGGARSGKSCLAVQLLLDGMPVTGDAAVLLGDGQAIPWPLAFGLGEESVALLPGLVADARFQTLVERPRAGWRVQVTPHSFGRRWRIAPAPVAAVFDLDPNFGGQNRVRPCGLSDMLRRILARAEPPADARGAWLANLSSVLAGAACHVLQLGDPEGAAAAVMSVLAGGRAP